MTSDDGVLRFEQLEQRLEGLHTYLLAQDYAGYDPYDGLESRVFKALPFSKLKWSRIAMTQFMKRFPWNIRKLLLAPKGRNPKGIALCVSALFHLLRTYQSSGYQAEACQLIDWLVANRAPRYSSYCWGYDFDWQSRTFFAPKNTPNAICSIFVANALLSAHEQSGSATYLNIARDTCTFLREHLLARAGGEIYFRYVPGEDVPVHNVNLLAAALLARVYTHAREQELIELAKQAAFFSVRRQNDDGSWYYGEARDQRWIDNFHTGFNLVALLRYQRYTGDNSFCRAVGKGHAFWEQRFFRDDGAPKYYSDAAYPLDAHGAAQAIVTHVEFACEDSEALEKGRRVTTWALRNLWSPAGFFYFQIHRFYTVRIPYLRWSQAWMFYALSSLLNAWQVSVADLSAQATRSESIPSKETGGIAR